MGGAQNLGRRRKSPSKPAYAHASDVWARVEDLPGPGTYMPPVERTTKGPVMVAPSTGKRKARVDVCDRLTLAPTGATDANCSPASYSPSIACLGRLAKTAPGSRWRAPFPHTAPGPPSPPRSAPAATGIPPEGLVYKPKEEPPHRRPLGPRAERRTPLGTSMTVLRTAAGVSVSIPATTTKLRAPLIHPPAKKPLKATHEGKRATVIRPSFGPRDAASTASVPPTTAGEGGRPLPSPIPSLRLSSPDGERTIEDVCRLGREAAPWIPERSGVPSRVSTPFTPSPVMRHLPPTPLPQVCSTPTLLESVRTRGWQEHNQEEDEKEASAPTDTHTGQRVGEDRTCGETKKEGVPESEECKGGDDADVPLSVRGRPLTPRIAPSDVDRAVSSLSRGTGGKKRHDAVTRPATVAQFDTKLRDRCMLRSRKPKPRRQRSLVNIETVVVGRAHRESTPLPFPRDNHSPVNRALTALGHSRLRCPLPFPSRFHPFPRTPDTDTFPPQHMTQTEEDLLMRPRPFYDAFDTKRDVLDVSYISDGDADDEDSDVGLDAGGRRDGP